VRWNGDGEHFNYYPYGEERGSTTNGREKFGTYFRDFPNQDYADQRYYDSTKGRFTTPDSYENTVGTGDPTGWNRYAYVGGDPINFSDQTGEGQCLVGQPLPCTTTVTGSMPGNPPGSIFGYGSGSVNGKEIPRQEPFGDRPPQGTRRGVSNKGGLNTNPSSTGATAWQYLASVWGDCLNDFKKDTRFNASAFESLLSGNDIQWLDSRDPSAGRTVDSYAHNGDKRTLADVVAGGDSAVTIPGTTIVILGANYFTDNTQTEQIGIAVHEALHIALGFNDNDLAGWLTNFGFRPSAPFDSHQITDWIVGTADHMSTSGGGCKNP
jgi:RHS repeat-associated protein